MTKSKSKPADQTQIRNEAWRRGLLKWKLRPVQRKMWEAIHAHDGLKFVINSSRRIGKSYLLCVYAIATAIRKPGSQIRFAAPTQKALRKITQPHMAKILKDCPLDLRPIYRMQEQVYAFPGGSEIHLAGVNSGHAENLRGTEADVFINDEAGTTTELRYLVEDIAMPQLLTTNGKLVMASTPPRTPAHDFVEYAHKAKLEGHYAHYTIYDSGYDKNVIERFKAEAGGENSSTWRREYLAEFIVDEMYALIPEWKPQFEYEFQLNEYWPFYHKYEALDIGVRDLTVCLFAHYDFKEAKLFIHDEVAMNGPEMTTEFMAKRIKETEKKTFGESPIRKRVSDIDLLLIQDLSRLHGLYFQPTDKGTLEEMVNEVRIWVNQGRVIVHPRCYQLIGCLKYGVWNERRTEFERSKTYGHFDALAALMYLIRNVDSRTNPIPIKYGKSEDDHFFLEETKSRSDKMKELFNVRGTHGRQRR